MLNKTIVFCLAIVYTVVLIYLSLATIDTKVLDADFKYQDKIFHFIAYFVLAIIWNIYVLLRPVKTNVFLVFVLMLIFAILLEYVQNKINTKRFFELLDMIANCLGVVFGTLFVFYYRKLTLKK